MNLLQRLVQLRPSLQDILSVINLKLFDFLSGFIGICLFRMKAKIFGIGAGKHIKCYGRIHLQRAAKSQIAIGNGVTIVSSSWRCSSGSIFAPTKLKTLSQTAKIIIEDDVGLNGTAITARSRCIRIGQGTIIAPNVSIMDSDFHALWPPEHRVLNPAEELDADVEIGKNVWIASRSVILKGVSIGDNSVIATGSVVTRDLPANVLAGGVPAREIRKLP